MVRALRFPILGEGLLLALLGCATSNPPPAAPSPLSPTQLQNGPSLHETGRIAGTSVSNTGVRIADTPVDRRAPREPRVESADDARTSPRPEAGVVDQAVLKREIRSRFVELNDCPSAIARHERTAASSLRARTLTLRWIILPSGQVANTAVVATSPVNVGVLDCVKRQMSLWSFAPPRGGSVSLERRFKFRR
jgi:hypothetical protein